ncbi:MAG: endonuclease [Chloroflexi bacterium]|nr:endonuclease [Chloroflexota bacterium]
MTTRESLLDIYRRLYERYGPQHWWPGETPFEVMAGAILTQSAAWTNVEQAISNLKTAGALSPESIRRMPVDELAALIRSSGYFNAKARKLKAMVQWLGDNFDDDPEKMSAMDTGELRKSLLAVHGIGEETADSIVLYAANKPIFVIDAYTRRILERVGVCPVRATSGRSHRHGYAAFQSLFMENLSPDTQMFNEYHALFVRHGKETCRKVPLCPQSCLREICDHGKKQHVESGPRLASRWQHGNIVPKY